MIPRYEVEEISNIWSLESKYSQFLKVESALIFALEKHNIAPKGSLESINKNAKINLERIDELDKITKHDVIAFCSSISEQLPIEIAKFFHFGVTSSDIIDSALSLQLKESLEIIRKDIYNLLSSLKDKALTHKNDICMGRSHGIYAEPMSLGQKFLSYYNELYRNLEKIDYCIDHELRCQFSGAVGNFTILDHQIEQTAANHLNLKVEEISTQIIPKDRLTHIIHSTIQVVLTVERLATQLRHYQRSEVSIMFEGFSAGQKGSSTMPHKKNPISAENICGLSRLLKSHGRIAEENNILWHERDISHSSNERLFLPDHFGILSYLLKRMTSLISNLQIETKKMEQNVLASDYYLSSYLMHQLLLKTSISREDIYKIIQELSFKAKESDILLTTLFNKKMKSLNISFKLPDMNLDKLKEIYLKETEYLFERSFHSYDLKQIEKRLS